MKIIKRNGAEEDFDNNKIVVAVAKANYVLIPINLTACVGFGMMLYWSWQESRQHG